MDRIGLMSNSKYRFCSVYRFRERLFLDREEGVCGPRRGVFPPEELSPAIEDQDLGREIRRALASYRETGKEVFADEWEALNRRLLGFFGERIVAAFERRKVGVTVREDPRTEEIRFFLPEESAKVLQDASDEELGMAVRELLGLSRR